MYGAWILKDESYDVIHCAGHEDIARDVLCTIFHLESNEELEKRLERLEYITHVSTYTLVYNIMFRLGAVRVYFHEPSPEYTVEYSRIPKHTANERDWIKNAEYKNEIKLRGRYG